jgi:hypothetical protein
MPTWEYLIDPLTALVNFAFFESQIALVGHSHLPLSFIVDKGDKTLTAAYANPVIPSKRNPGDI